MSILMVFLAILLFGILIAVHELGHFLAAKATGIPVVEFAIGMGPKVFSFRRGETVFSLRALPLGGFCSFVGETEESDDPRAMRNQKVWKRFLTVLAGPAMNFVLGYLIICIFLTCIGVRYTVPSIGELQDGGSAQAAGLEIGDIIESVDGETVSYDLAGAQAVSDAVSAAGPSGEIELIVRRDGQSVPIVLSPKETEEGARIGVVFGYATWRMPLPQALGESFPIFADYIRSMFEAFGELFSTGEGLEDTMGPVGIIQFASQEIRRGGFEQALNLLLVLTLNLGIVNLVPIAPLDGGALLLLAIEGVRRRPIPKKYEIWAQAAGTVLLIGLVLTVTGNDLVRLFSGRGFGG